MIRDPSDGSVREVPEPDGVTDLKAKYGPNYGLKVDEKPKKPPQPAPTVDELIQFYRTNPERVARLMGETGE